MADTLNRPLEIGYSVARNVRVDELRPGVDSATQRHGLGEACRPENERCVETAHAVMAIADDELVLARLDLRGVPRQLVERHERASRQTGEVVLPSLADVQKVGLLASLHPRCKLLDRDLSHPAGNLRTFLGSR